MANNIQNNRDKNITVSDYKELMDFLIGQFDKVHETMATKADLTTKADKVDIDRVLARFAMLNNKIDDRKLAPIQAGAVIIADARQVAPLPVIAPETIGAKQTRIIFGTNYQTTGL